MCGVVYVRRDWCTRHCTVREGATYGRRKFGDKISFCLVLKIVLADEGTDKVIIIGAAPIRSESGTLLFAVVSH